MGQTNNDIFYDSSKVPRLRKSDQLVIVYENGDVFDYVVKQCKDAGHIYLCDCHGAIKADVAAKLNRLSNVAYLPMTKPRSYRYTGTGKLSGISLTDGTTLHCTKVLIMKGE